MTAAHAGATAVLDACDEIGIGRILDLACALRGGDELAIARATRAALDWHRDPQVTLRLACALIVVDRPANVWWERLGKPCAWCGGALPTPCASGRKYCRDDCFTAHRRKYWRDRQRARNAARRTAKTSEGR